MGLRQQPPGPPQAPPSGSPSGPPQGGGEGGGASQLVAKIFEDMSKLMSMIDQGGDPQDAQKLGAIMQAYQQFVQEDLGSAPGQKPPQPEGPQAPTVSQEAGASNVRPAY